MFAKGLLHCSTKDLCHAGHGEYVERGQATVRGGRHYAHGISLSEGVCVYVWYVCVVCVCVIVRVCAIVCVCMCVIRVCGMVCVCLPCLMLMNGVPPPHLHAVCLHTIHITHACIYVGWKQHAHTCARKCVWIQRTHTQAHTQTRTHKYTHTHTHIHTHIRAQAVLGTIQRVRELVSTTQQRNVGRDLQADLFHPRRGKQQPLLTQPEAEGEVGQETDESNAVTTALAHYSIHTTHTLIHTHARTHTHAHTHSLSHAHICTHIHPYIYNSKDSNDVDGAAVCCVMLSSQIGHGDGGDGGDGGVVMRRWMKR